LIEPGTEAAVTVGWLALNGDVVEVVEVLPLEDVLVVLVLVDVLFEPVGLGFGLG
jgi:hypothetical protein